MLESSRKNNKKERNDAASELPRLTAVNLFASCNSPCSTLAVLQRARKAPASAGRSPRMSRRASLSGRQSRLRGRRLCLPVQILYPLLFTCCCSEELVSKNPLKNPRTSLAFVCLFLWYIYS